MVIKNLASPHGLLNNEILGFQMCRVLNFAANHSLKMRHRIVKLITPNVYRQSTRYLEIVNRVPRPMITFLKWNNWRELVGAEIGVAEGNNAVSILTELSIKKLYLIDPFTPYLENNCLCSHANHRNIARKRLNLSQVVFIEKKSEDAILEINEPLDFVYIDGNHDYNFVKQDIELYYKLVRLHGMVGGHDIELKSVQKAVNEFCSKTQSRLFNLFPDWWIIKGN